MRNDKTETTKPVTHFGLYRASTAQVIVNAFAAKYGISLNSEISDPETGTIIVTYSGKIGLRRYEAMRSFVDGIAVACRILN